MEGDGAKGPENGSEGGKAKLGKNIPQPKERGKDRSPEKESNLRPVTLDGAGGEATWFGKLMVRSDLDINSLSEQEEEG